MMSANIRSERKYLEILRILKESHEPMGAKRLSELMADRGFILSDRAVQYYLRYLDEMGFTAKVGNRGRILTEQGLAETESALVDERIGFIISKLERLAFRSNFDPESGTGNVAYNLSYAPIGQKDGIIDAFSQVIRANCGFFNAYRVVDADPRIPEGHVGFMTVCSVTLDGVLQNLGIPVRLEYAGRLALREDGISEFIDLIGYRGTTIDPLQLLISAGLTSINRAATTGCGIVLANAREVPAAAADQVLRTVEQLKDCGFSFPEGTGRERFNLQEHPYRLPVVSYTGMNMVGNAVEKGYTIRTEIGSGTIPFSKICDII